MTTNSGMIGNPDTLAISYSFFDDDHDTEIGLYAKGENLLAFEREGKHLTTRWDLDDLVTWLAGFVKDLHEDPCPIEVSGDFAALADYNARSFDTTDDVKFQSYYETLNAWRWEHTWHNASAGAILANLFFELKGNSVEISWDNRNGEEYVAFDNLFGSTRVDAGTFKTVIDEFVTIYQNHWAV